MAKRRGAGTHKWKKTKRIPVDINEPDSDSPKPGSKPMVDGSRTWGIGECLSVDDVGPINPESHEGYQHYHEGYQHYFIFKCMFSKMIFIYLTDATNEDSYIYSLNEVVQFFKRLGHKCGTIRGDYYTSFRSEKVI